VSAISLRRAARCGDQLRGRLGQLEQAFPGIPFRARTVNWWARLTRVPAECVHLELEHAWMATLVADTLYLRGHAVRRRGLRQPARPEVSLCRACLLDVLEPELAAYPGRVVAFEPDPANFTQYFFLATLDFEAAGLQPEVAAAIEQRLAAPGGACEYAAECSQHAQWLWLPQQQVRSLDEASLIALAPGWRLCPTHGAATLCRCFEEVSEANLFYVNVPYGEAGAYVWI
jgi:hypothetical protein